MRSTLLTIPTLFSNSCFFFFNDTPTTQIYTLSLHDALPISVPRRLAHPPALEPARREEQGQAGPQHWRRGRDRKSTRLNSSHRTISYAVFCLKKKKTADKAPRRGVRSACSTKDET